MNNTDKMYSNDELRAMAQCYDLDFTSLDFLHIAQTHGLIVAENEAERRGCTLAEIYQFETCGTEF